MKFSKSYHHTKLTLIILKKLFHVSNSNWILMSCQPHMVTSGQSNSGHKQITFLNSSHICINPLPCYIFVTVPWPNNNDQQTLTFLHSGPCVYRTDDLNCAVIKETIHSNVSLYDTKKKRQKYFL